MPTKHLPPVPQSHWTMLDLINCFPVLPRSCKYWSNASIGTFVKLCCRQSKRTKSRPILCFPLVMKGLVDWQKIDLQKIITEILASKNTYDWNTVYTENWIHLCVCVLLRKKTSNFKMTPWNYVSVSCYLCTTPSINWKIIGRLTKQMAHLNLVWFNLSQCWGLRGENRSIHSICLFIGPNWQFAVRVMLISSCVHVHNSLCATCFYCMWTRPDTQTSGVVWKKVVCDPVSFEC